ncbi:MAG: outer membrane protein assembly factor BamE [Xanthomonadales bacterium]|nr:outer membrane protein assembly factor BamE [Gammaproteobacteria bacterium]MBT8051959.1 outer membrane protein assembly factor BamE [Gammaproteobacteria bacterium]MBT8057198.1 outer membrane protein assembly factor BamE [Gammaproteobacteria bacterium]NNJ79242.1 outer membrane protein assembly factor BamE [Xanthomonadales bacterium]NNL06063.1 outer membrane protein assembly factor BamE [Xanthomonadales bacterium]
MTLRTPLTAVFVLLLSTGCGLIYKQNIQQGNALEQDDLDELYIGMNQRQVLFVLGTPSVKDPFNPDRWDYVQTFSRRGNDPVKRTVTLRFEDGLLSDIEGQDNPFAPAGGDTGDSEEVASFVKPRDSDQTESPQDAALESVQEEVLEGVDEDEEAVNERNAEDRDYQRGMDVLDQTPDDSLTTPDIDG